MRNCRVHIIESPSADDIFTEQYEGQILRGALRYGQVPVELHTVVDPQHFARALAAVINSYKRDQDSFPILHLSMHGNENEVAFTNGDTVDWPALGEGLSLINEALHDKLLVLMSACQGYNAARMARREGHAPFFALVGPTANISWKDTVAAFGAFYHHVIVRDGSIVSGVQVINSVLRTNIFQATTAADELAEWRTEKAAADEERLRRIADRVLARWQARPVGARRT
ncbi:hypothetical protein [Polyangium sorediatum]|uniref:CHAT domain-containing protein n=1 Tax=Polyangium sorediatum TaxID=889274 RepID=A0ABT6PA65_9BACT|nr:hypothetical protein [Polyangium sorediatum]MDI1437509.1 hypothetical protein [Polyangium sorediatum]